VSKLEETLALHLRAEKIEFEREVSGLVPGRRFRVDFFIKPDITVDCEGAVWVKGGHSTGTGITRDCLKANLLLLAGYRPFRVTAQHIESGEALQWVLAALGK
jgi:hypothetical protein